MNFLRRHLPERLHKRTIVVLVSVIIVVVVLVGLILWAASGFVVPSDATTFAFTQAEEKTYVAGLGLNLLNMPKANLLSNGAFDNPVLQTQYLADGGNAESFSVTASESIGNLPLANGYFNGANISIFRGGQGGFKKLHEASIDDYAIGKLLNRSQVELPENLAEIRWFDFAEMGDKSDLVVAAGSEGTFLALSGSGEHKISNSGHKDDITAIVYGSDGFLAVDRGGRFYVSDDGLEFSELDIRAVGYLTDVAFRFDPGGESGFYLVGGQSGQIYLGRGREFDRLEIPTKNNINSFVVPDEGIMYALGDGGTALYSHDGIEWKQDEQLTVKEDWLAGDATAEVMFIVGEKGRMALKVADEGFNLLDRDCLLSVLELDEDTLPADKDKQAELSWPDLREVSLFSSEHFLIITDKGDSYQSLDQASNWKIVNFNDDDSIGLSKLERLASGRVFLAMRDGSIDWASFASVFSFTPTMENDQVTAGDYITVDLPLLSSLETIALPDLYAEAEMVEGDWYISGQAAASFIPLDEIGLADSQKGTLTSGPRGSIMQLKLSESDVNELDEDDARLDKKRLFSISNKTVTTERVINPMRPYLDLRLVQKIDGRNVLQAIEPSVFPLEMDLRVEGNVDGPIELWLSTSDFEVVEEIEIEAGSWQHISKLLILPRPIKEKDDLFFNIAFSGSGSLYLDNIFLGRSDEQPNALSNLANKAVEKIPHCSLLRLDCVPIGKPGFEKNAWALPEGDSTFNTKNNIRDSKRHNLGVALQFTQMLDASPWLVVDSRCGDSELNNLIEYIAGSPLSEFGKIRGQDGALGRWSDSFDLIYLEFIDSQDSLPSDYLKAQRVDWLVSQCQKSPLYQDINKKIVFVDGMNYEMGGYRTSVDFHASDLHFDQSFDNYAELDRFLSEWHQSMPRRPVVGSAFQQEIVRSLKFIEPKDIEQIVEKKDITTADLCALTLRELSEETEHIMLDMDLYDLFRDENSKITAILELAEPIEGSYAVDNIVRREASSKNPIRDNKESYEYASSSADLVEKEREGANWQDQQLILFSFQKEDKFLIVAVNFSQSTEQFVLKAMPQIEQIRAHAYDINGRFIAEDTQSHIRSSWVVMPGGMLVLEMDLSE